MPCKEEQKNAIVRNKDQDFMAFVIHPDADYRTVITKAAGILGLNADNCGLVHLNGSRIQNRMILENEKRYPWSTGKYLLSAFARTSSVRLGLFYEDEYSEVCDTYIISRFRSV